MSKKRIAVIGAGPIGLEAALYAASLGHDVHVYEQGQVGGHVRRWGHVRLFSAAGLNRSMLGLRQLRQLGSRLPEDSTCLTGLEHVETYLEPLSRTPLLAGRIHEHSRVLHIGREYLGKADLIGGPREKHPFRLLIRTPAGERLMHADTVIDCGGTYGRHNWMGNGNVPAIGELALRDRIAYRLEDIAGRARARYAGRRVLLVGAGYSAATALSQLIELPGTSVVWVVRRDDAAPYAIVPDDPLPERERISRRANRIAAGSETGVRYRRATVVERVALGTDGFEVELRSPPGSETVVVDRILAHVGYSPDRSLYRELQVHECYATFGPMKLSASLLGGGTTDCLAQSSGGPETLRNPEPDFYILGAKSYGKNSSFLIRTGIEQVRDLFTLIENKPELNLYAA